MDPEPGLEEADKCHASDGSFKVPSSASCSSGYLNAIEASASSSSSVSVAGHDVVEISNNNCSAVIPETASNEKHKQVVIDQHSHEHLQVDFADYLVGSNSSRSGSSNGILKDTSESGADDPEDYELEDDYDDYVLEDDVVGNNDYDLAAKLDDLPPGVEATVPWLQMLTTDKATMNNKAANADETDDKFSKFKQFDVVQDYSDHHFSKPENVPGTSLAEKPSKDWTKRIQREWGILEKDLPGTIFVRAYEQRMDLLRAVIIGPPGTPYHDGLFFFDCLFPSTYPDAPPLVHYHSGGLYLNPNLYPCGKVCLSLLGTWTGKGCEKWSAVTSTMLQVLVSIQALVLNEKPYFNEPGHAGRENSDYGMKKSLAYNREAFLLSCKTMIYSLRRPPKNFEEVVTEHFRINGRTILLACRAYVGGALVGCAVGNEILDVAEDDLKMRTSFQTELEQLSEELLMEFTVKGADCDVFLRQMMKARQAKAKAVSDPDTTLKL